MLTLLLQVVTHNLRADEIAKIEGVDAVLGSSEKFRIFDLINDFEKEEFLMYLCEAN